MRNGESISSLAEALTSAPVLEAISKKALGFHIICCLSFSFRNVINILGVTSHCN